MAYNLHRYSDPLQLTFLEGSKCNSFIESQTITFSSIEHSHSFKYIADSTSPVESCSSLSSKSSDSTDQAMEDQVVNDQEKEKVVIIEKLLFPHTPEQMNIGTFGEAQSQLPEHTPLFPIQDSESMEIHQGILQTHKTIASTMTGQLSSIPTDILSPEDISAGLNTWDTLSFMSSRDNSQPTSPQYSNMTLVTPVQDTIKKKRKALSLTDKIRVIDLYNGNPNSSIQTLSKSLGIARSTIYGILEKKTKIMGSVFNQPRMSRVIEDRFRVLEELLVFWHNNLARQGITVSDKKICAQAFDIHRMLSGLLNSPLPHCMFTAGWLMGFKKRRMNSLTIPDSQEILAVNTTLCEKLFSYSTEDIYFSDITSMYLDMMPKYLHSENVAEYNTKWRAYASGVTILFCCNASGNDMVEPLVLVRESSSSWLPNYNDRIIPDSWLEDINTMTMWNWLKDFDNNVQRRVILLIDQNMWKQFDLEKVGENTHLRYVELLCIPQGFSPYLPMKQGIIGDFKKYYHILLLENSSKLLKSIYSVNTDTSYTHQYEGSEPAKPISREVFKQLHTLLSQLRSIPYAWIHISGKAVENYYRIFLQKLVGMTLDDFPRRIRQHISESAPEKILREKLEVVFPDLPKAVYQYYQNMDNDIGPSQFLREKIVMMRDNEGFIGCFGNCLNFGTVQFGSKRLRSNERFADTKHKIHILKNYDLELFQPLDSPLVDSSRLTSQEKLSPLMYTLRHSITI